MKLLPSCSIVSLVLVAACKTSTAAETRQDASTTDATAEPSADAAGKSIEFTVVATFATVPASHTQIPPQGTTLNCPAVQSHVTLVGAPSFKPSPPVEMPNLANFEIQTIESSTGACKQAVTLDPTNTNVTADRITLTVSSDDPLSAGTVSGTTLTCPPAPCADFIDSVGYKGIKATLTGPNPSGGIATVHVEMTP
jgi:hypothetical protein